jgi:hypothetical protein
MAGVGMGMQNPYRIPTYPVIFLCDMWVICLIGHVHKKKTQKPSTNRLLGCGVLLTAAGCSWRPPRGET